MNIEIPSTLISRNRAKLKDPYLTELRLWRDVELVDSDNLNPDTISILNAEALKITDPDSAMMRFIRKSKQIIKGRDPQQAHRDLKTLAEAMRNFLRKAKNHWMMYESTGKNDYDQPVLVTDCKYVEEQRGAWSYIPAHISIKYMFQSRGDNKSDSFAFYKKEHMEEGGMTPQEVFALASLFPFSEEHSVTYSKLMSLYEKYRQKIGIQVSVSGKVAKATEQGNEYAGNWWDMSSGEYTAGINNQPQVMVIDDEFGWDDDSAFAKVEYLTRLPEPDSSNLPIVPIAPYVMAFDFRVNGFCFVRVEQISEYVYNETIIQNLIIERSTKQMIQALLDFSTSKNEGDDVIEGKGKSTIILSSGAPGTGKTLTAEVYAENSRSPLYTVQCSQLGLTPEKVEENLEKVLLRAKRWGAVLLIDESDVYIQERGSSIQQNAVIGVFLRLLEYFEGVMFMTTNRETMVDDAIRSRCILHLRYRKPNNVRRSKLFELMGKQFKLKLTPELVGQLVEKFPEISGRDIKNLVRLSKIMSDSQNSDIDLALFEKAARFTDIDTTGEA